ncbi:DUF4411 family protein [Oxalobacteraceae bacterium CAVE-383]|nr:DUF4411 family protein [Oxalobacteraceae bacterium CAVE-383]
MPKTDRYLLDSDVLITAKNLHYNPKFCGMFWSWVSQAHKSGNIFSIDKVREELLVGDVKDPLHKWAKDPALNKFFLSSQECTAHWTKLANWANLPEKSFKEVAKVKFLDVDSADAWLIAYAVEHQDCVIVTNEVSSPFSKVSIKLPDAAKHMGVKTTTLFSLLERHSADNFTFQL